MNDILTKKGTPVVLKPPYWLEPCVCDFFLFPKHKFHIKDHHFGNMDVMTDQLTALPHEDFQHCYRKWERLWQCVASQRNYFERDGVYF
jgi:hypothetical protein